MAWLSSALQPRLGARSLADSPRRVAPEYLMHLAPSQSGSGKRHKFSIGKLTAIAIS